MNSETKIFKIAIGSILIGVFLFVPNSKTKIFKIAIGSILIGVFLFVPVYHGSAMVKLVSDWGCSTF